MTLPTALLPRLTPRERQICDQIRAAACNKEIAFRLGITEGTVKIYLSRLLQRLNLTSRLELAALLARADQHALEQQRRALEAENAELRAKLYGAGADQ